MPSTDDEFHSYWIQFQILVPDTYSLMEEHESSQQGESVFQGLEDTPSDGIRDDLDAPAHDAEEDTTGAQGDGGGTVALPPGRGTPGGTSDDRKVVVYVPGTDTAITYTPSTGTVSHVNEGTPQLTDTTTRDTLDPTNRDEQTGTTGQAVDPDTINKVTLVADVTNDGLQDMIVCTTDGAYLMRSKGTGNEGFEPPVLLSDSADNVKDAVTMDFDGDGFQDIVLVTDGTAPNRVYLGDGTDPDQSNMAGDTFGGLRHEVLGGGLTPNTDTTAVVALDVNQDGATESLLVTNNDAEDVFYFDGDLTGVKLGDTVDTTSVDAAAYDADNTLVVFGKSSGTGGAKDTYMLVEKTHSTDEALSVRTFDDDDVVFLEGAAATRNTHTVRVVPNPEATGSGDVVFVYFGYDRQDDAGADTEKADPVVGSFMRDLYLLPAGPDDGPDQVVMTLIRPGGSGEFALNADGSESELSQGVRDMTVVTRFDETTPASPDVVFTTDGGSVFVVRAAGSPTAGTTTYDKSSDSNVQVVVLAGEESESNRGVVQHADLDGDGYQDVVSGRHVVLNTDTNKGDFTTVPVEYWSYGPTPLSVTPADVDADGDVDLIVVPRDTSGPVLQYLLNDGSGDFSNAERVVPLAGTTPIAVSGPTDTTTTVVTGHLSGPNGALDDVLDFIVADDNGLTFYISTSTTKTDHKYSAVTTLSSVGAVTDLLVVSLSGQPPTSGSVGAQQDVVYVAGGVVYGLDGSAITDTAVPTFVALSGTGLGVKTVAVGNVMGDALKTVLTIGDGVTPVRPSASDPAALTEGQVDSSGNVRDPTQIDARSLDLVYSSDTRLYTKQGVYDADAGAYLSALGAATEHLVAEYDTSGTGGQRTVTAVEVHDMVCTRLLEPHTHHTPRTHAQSSSDTRR